MFASLYHEDVHGNPPLDLFEEACPQLVELAIVQNPPATKWQGRWLVHEVGGFADEGPGHEAKLTSQRWHSEWTGRFLTNQRWLVGLGRGFFLAQNPLLLREAPFL